MIRLFNRASILGAVLALAVLVSPASAAKGVKKNHEHHVKGTVVSVHHGKKGAHGTLTIRVTHHKQQKGANVAKTKSVEKTFEIDKHTHVDVAGKGRVALATLHPGEHVTILAHHHHADKVVIHHTSKNKKVAKG